MFHDFPTVNPNIKSHMKNDHRKPMARQRQVKIQEAAETVDLPAESKAVTFLRRGTFPLGFSWFYIYIYGTNI